ncbi:hypothetical protein D3C78_1580730 [compost metagenome]
MITDVALAGATTFISWVSHCVVQSNVSMLVVMKSPCSSIQLAWILPAVAVVAQRADTLLMYVSPGVTSTRWVAGVLTLTVRILRAAS